MEPAPELPEPLARYVTGELSAPLALTQWLMRAGSVEAAAPLLADPRLTALASLLADNRAGAQRALAVLGRLDHDRPSDSVEAAIDYLRGAFDGAVATDPASSVALYTLGDERLLQVATAEIVALLRRWGLLGRQRRVLDLGCGIGRIAAAVSAEVASVTGIDISPGMVAEARRRCAGLDNVAIRLGTGRDLAGIGDQSVDLVLAVDSFPYLFMTGRPLVATHIAEAARVLAPGGDLVILNFSYRADIEADRRDVAELAAAAALDVVRNGTRELELWDGVSFALRRPGEAQ